MNQKKLAPLLALIISFELVIAPLAANAQSSTQNIMSALTIGSAAYNTFQGMGTGMRSPQFQVDMQALTAQQTPQPDQYFNPSKLSAIPGLNDYLARNNINPQQLSCATLPTTVYEAKNEVCRLGITSDTGIQPADQMAEMFSYYNQYTQVNKLYRNYTATSNAGGQLFGVGCMKNAMQILNGFFKSRIDELDKLSTELEALNNQFREGSRTDLDAIEEDTAVLDGGTTDIANKVRTKKPELFDFGKRFQNDACTSMFSSMTFDQDGKNSGLNGIRLKLRTTISDARGNPAYSGESYAKNNNNVVADITSMADKIAKQSQLQFTSMVEGGNPTQGFNNFLKTIPTLVTSSNNITNSLRNDIFTDTESAFTDSFQKLSTQKAAIYSELSAKANPDAAMALLGNLNSGNFEAEMTALQNQIKNKCLSDTLQATSIDSVVGQLYSPTGSKFANSNPTGGFMQAQLHQILDNTTTSFDRKLAQLKQLESDNPGLFLKISRPYQKQTVDGNNQIQTQFMDPSTKPTPTVFFSDIIGNCNAQFKANVLNNKMSGETAINNLRTLNQQYKTLAQTNAASMKQEIMKKLIECKDNSIANSDKVGSCKPDVFDTQQPGFCANAANSCSLNMQQCTAQADKFVSDIKGDRTVRVNNYKALVQKNKADIVKIFDTALSKYMKEGEALRASFGVGFTSPTDIKREILPESGRYLDNIQQATASSIDGAMLLEDPDKYVAMFKKNLDALKTSVQAQQDQIVGGGVGKNSGILADHMKQTEDNYKDVVTSSQAMADACIAKHDEAVKNAETQRNQMAAAQNKKTGELNDQVGKFCRQYGIVARSPNPSCASSVSELTDSVLSVVNTSEARDAAANFATVCNSFNNQSVVVATDDPELICGGDKSPQLEKLCNQRTKEQKNLLSLDSNNSKDREASQNLIDSYEVKIDSAYKAMMKSHLASKGKQIQENMQTPPSFCNAQNNSTGNPKSFMDQLGQQGNPLAIQGQGIRY